MRKKKVNLLEQAIKKRHLQQKYNSKHAIIERYRKIKKPKS
jgi:hypothetical protein